MFDQQNYTTVEDYQQNYTLINRNVLTDFN